MHVAVPASRIELVHDSSAKSNRAARYDALSDGRLTSSVKTALIAAGARTAKQILIETANGIVSLSGPVDSQAVKDETLATARSVWGVASVVDHLVIRDVPTRDR